MIIVLLMVLHLTLIIFYTETWIRNIIFFFLGGGNLYGSCVKTWVDYAMLTDTTWWCFHDEINCATNLWLCKWSSIDCMKSVIRSLNGFFFCSSASQLFLRLCIVKWSLWNQYVAKSIFTHYHRDPGNYQESISGKCLHQQIQEYIVAVFN